MKQIENKKFKAVSRIFDVINYPEFIRIQNQSNEKIHIGRNEKIVEISECENFSIYTIDTKKFNDVDVETILNKTISNDELIRDNLRIKLMALNQNDIIKVKRPVEHEIKYDNNVKFKNNQNAYRTNLEQKKRSEKILRNYMIKN